MKKILTLALCLMLCGCGSAKKDQTQTADTNNKQNVKVTERQNTQIIRLIVGKKTYQATLNKSKAAQSFMSLMPMELNLAHNSYSYYCMMDNSLNAKDQTMTTVHQGDIILQSGNTVYFVNKTYDLKKKATRLGEVTDSAFFDAVKKNAIVNVKKG